VNAPKRDNIHLPYLRRIKDEAFRRAVELFDTGDIGGLREHLLTHPEVVHQRVTFEGGNYFRNPALLEFIAENPTRNGRLPKNAVEGARVMLEAGAKADRKSLDSALDLVASSSVARESGLQIPLIDLLVDYGADPNAATYVASLYGEFGSVRRLLKRGAKLDLLVAAALNRPLEAEAALSEAEEESRQRALAMAAQHGNADIVRLLLDAGADPNRFAPVGGHSHATPLHQAALGGHEDVVRLLVERGARSDIPDIHHGETPLGWALYGKQGAVAEFLRRIGA
jgi:ankyrin repeat protein